MKDLRKFSKYYKPYIGTLILDLLFATIMAGCELVFPMIVRYITGEILPSGADDIVEKVLIFGAICIGVKIVGAIASYFITFVGHNMGVKLEADMRIDIVTHLQELSYSFYDNQKVGKIMSRVTNDLFDITEFSHHCPEEIYIAFIRIVGSFSVLISIHPILTVSLFALFPMMLIPIILFRKKMRKAFRDSRAQVAEINAGLEDSLSGVRVVKSFANEDIEIEKFSKENNKFKAVRKRAYNNMAKFHSGTLLCEGIMYSAVVVLGSIFMNLGQIELADLLAYLLYIQVLLTTVRTIIDFTEMFEQGLTGISRFNEIMDVEPEIKDADDAIDIEKVSGEISFKNVTFAYNEKRDVLNNFTIDIAKGENVAIVGPSGSGKTTISNLIPRFYEISKGEILIDGVDIRKISQHSLRTNIGIVQQDVYLFGGTVAENIGYGKIGASREEIEEAAKAAGAHDFICELPEGYDTYVGERGVKLSGGQKQRISIARLFLKNPPVLILDEATSALDNENEKLVQESLERLAKGRTTITIAHRLTTVRNADRIVVLLKDGIKEQGSHDELIAKNGEYAKLYEMYK